MNLFEFEGKELFSNYEIPVPHSKLLCSEEEEAPLRYPFVLKAQVMTGGRGKAGGVKVCHNEKEYKKYASDILHMTIKGHPVHGVLAEEMIQAEKELYVSITLQGVEKPTLIVSSMGGMDIEEVSHTQPDKILKLEIDPFTGLKEYQLKYIAKVIDIENKEDFFQLIKKVETAFFQSQAVLVEINPLGIVNGKFIAMDSKVVLDSHSKKTEKYRINLEQNRTILSSYQTPEIEKTTITYVPLEGEIGLISDGAGTGMLTLDLVYDNGGSVASFCELGGTTPAEVMYRAMELTMAKGNAIKSLLIVLIGGFNRMDDMANGITKYIKDNALDIPIFTRMCGTMENEGKNIMKDNGLLTYDNLTQTVKYAVNASKGVR